MSVAVYPKKVIRNFGNYGIVITIQKMFMNFIKPFFNYVVYRFYLINLNAIPFKSIERKDFQFKFLSSDDTQLIEQIEQMEEWLENLLQKRLKAGSICLVVLKGPHVVGFNLVSFGKIYIPLVEQWRTFDKNEAWSEQITVHKNYRRRGLASDIRYRIFNELKSMGISYFYGAALRNNYGSLSLACKVGFKLIYDLHFVKFLGIKNWSIKRLTEKNVR